MKNDVRANRFSEFSIAELQHLLAGLFSSPFVNRDVQPTEDLIKEIGAMLDKRISEEEEQNE
jgi:hypothetical protein